MDLFARQFSKLGFHLWPSRMEWLLLHARFVLNFSIGTVCVGSQLLNIPTYMHNEAPTCLLVFSHAFF